MVRLVCALLVAVAFVSGDAGAAAAECVAAQQARSLIQSGQAVPLAAAIRAARGSAEGEMIDSRLCKASGGYQYIVTFLGSEGRVVRVTVDGRSGKVAGVK